MWPFGAACGRASVTPAGGLHPRVAVGYEDRDIFLDLNVLSAYILCYIMHGYARIMHELCAIQNDSLGRKMPHFACLRHFERVLSPVPTQFTNSALFCASFMHIDMRDFYRQFALISTPLMP